MKVEAIPASVGDYNLTNYEEKFKQFDWKETEKNFSWYETGNWNMAYEAIDRHAESYRKNKVALYYDEGVRKEKYTFKEMKELSNKAGNLFKQVGVEKGDRVFIFMPRSPELYFSLLGAIKLGAIVGPLFEAFMEGAVRDRLDDSEAKVIVTTNELLSRIPVEDLPSLKHIFVVGNEIEESEKFIDFNKHFQEASTKLDIEWVDVMMG